MEMRIVPDELVPDRVRDREVSLGTVSPGRAFLVSRVDAGGRATRRLFDMGLAPGARVTVLSSRRFGPLIVMADRCRLGIGRGLAEKVLVCPEPPEPS